MTATIEVNHEPDGKSCRLIYDGEVSMDSIIQLLRSARTLLFYYKYDTITLCINSPGGEVGALKYYIHEMYTMSQEMDEVGRIFTLKTVAIGQACSAAAVMLSLGTPGQRFAYDFSHLLYHNTRFTGMSNNALTGENLNDLYTKLKQTDSFIGQVLMRHIHQDIDATHFGLINTLNNIDTILAGRQQFDLAQISLLNAPEIERCAKEINAINAGVATGKNLERRLQMYEEKLKKALQGLWKILFPKTERMSLADLDLLAFSEPSEIIFGLLVRKMLLLEDLFSRDKEINHSTAIELGLIDSVIPARMVGSSFSKSFCSR